MPHDYQLIRENLRLTQEYCKFRLANSTFDNAAIFRSINPEYGGAPLFTYTKAFFGDFNIPEWGRDPIRNGNETLIQELFDYQLKIKKECIEGERKNEINKEGKILACRIDLTLVDGAAGEASEGILDSYNFPPIDTWFHYIDAPANCLLLAWIPAFFTHLVNDGIDVNPEECIQWLDIWDPEMSADTMR